MIFVKRQQLFRLFWNLIACFALLVIAEGLSHTLEHWNKKTIGIGGKRIAHDTLGFLPQAGVVENITDEYHNRLTINAYNMNDTVITAARLEAPIRIMLLGDSHTYGTGVSTLETFSWQLNNLLFQQQNTKGTVFNCAVVGYSLGQYLLRYRQLKKIFRPTTVIIGFSAATDLYDLLPPRKGGFIYGENFGRVYHDLDNNNQLIEVHDLVGKKIGKGKNSKANVSQITLFTRFKHFVKSRSLYRRVKTSSLALYLATNLPFNNDLNLWEGVETAVVKDLSIENTYRWQLAAQILRQFAQETRQDGVKLVLFNIAYYPIVNDEVWKKSFGNNPAKYDREVCSRRLATICDTLGIDYLDSTPLLRKEHATQPKALYYPQDKHPTATGHLLLAKLLAEHLQNQSKVSN